MENLSFPLASDHPSVLVYCQRCFEVRHFTPYDTASPYQLEDDEIIEEPDHAPEVFFRQHHGHPLALLRKKKDRYWADRPLWDPFRIAYQEVTNGQETFVLKSWRTELAAPRQYALLHGSLVISTEVCLPQEPLQSTLRRELLCTEAQSARLAQLFHRTVANLPAEELVLAYCSADDPQVSFAYLADHHLRMLARRCRDTGVTVEQERLWAFLVRHRTEDALTVEIRQHCSPQFF